MLFLLTEGGKVFAQLKVLVGILTTGVADISSLKTKLDRRKAVLRMLETYFLLKDCADDGSALIFEAGPNPVATITALHGDIASETLERWNRTLRKQGIRLHRLSEYISNQDHLGVVAPEVQEQIDKAIGSKWDRVTTLAGIGAALIIPLMFPVAESPKEKAEMIVVMAGGRRDAIDIRRIKREVKALSDALTEYRGVIESLVLKEEIVKLSSVARKATQFA
jgi:hypothetical protein